MSDEKKPPGRKSHPTSPPIPIPEGSRKRRVTVDFTNRDSPLSLPDLSDEEEPSKEFELPRTSAVGLVDRARKRSSVRLEVDFPSEMRERFALDDFSGALRIAELLLGQDPGNPEATRVAQESRARLGQILLSRLGGEDKIPTRLVDENEARWLGLDHRASTVLSAIDSQTSIRELPSATGIPRLEVLRALADLLSAGAIGVRGES